jgi:hypothetical protein
MPSTLYAARPGPPGPSNNRQSRYFFFSNHYLRTNNRAIALTPFSQKTNAGKGQKIGAGRIWAHPGLRSEELSQIPTLKPIFTNLVLELTGIFTIPCGRLDDIQSFNSQHDHTLVTVSPSGDRRAGGAFWQSGTGRRPAVRHDPDRWTGHVSARDNPDSAKPASAMKLNDPFGRVGRRQSQAYASLSTQWHQQGVRDAAAVAQVAQTMRRSAGAWIAIILGSGALAMLLFAGLRGMILVLGGLALLWIAVGWLQTRLYLQRYLREECQITDPTDTGEDP